MAQPTNTFSSYQSIGNREDLSDVIYNIAPTETPFMSNIGKSTAENTLFEWQTDTLAAAAANAQIEGDDAPATAVVPTVRVTNRTQISRKVIQTTGTQEAIRKAGRKGEMAYQIALKGKELKRDMEFALTQNTTAVTGNDTTARQTRGLEGWVATNNDLGATGVAPNPTTNTAPVDGTARAFTETILKNLLQKVFVSGGNPDVILLGASQKQTASTFTGGNTRMDMSEDKKVVAAVDVYVSDFGTLKIMPSRFQRARTGFVLETAMWDVAFLRPFDTQDLAKTGDSQKKLLLCEYGLRSKQEAASGAARDLI